MRRLRPALAFALAPLFSASVALAAPAPAHAAPRSPERPATPSDAAREHFARGVALFQEGQHAAALVEFRRAYEAVPNFRVEYNIARTCLELKEDACALGAFEHYLSEGGSNVDAPRRAEIERELAKLRRRVGAIELLVNVPGADVSIDEVPVGTSPLPSPVPVAAGRHRIAASLPSGPSSYRFIEVAGGEHLSVALTIAVPKAPEPVVALAPQLPPLVHVLPPRAPDHTGLWIGLAITSTLATGAGITGYFAAREHAEFEQSLRSPTASSGEADRHRAQGRTLSLITDAGAATALAVGAVTLYLALNPERSRLRPAASASTLQLQAGPQGVGLRYTF